ncbi:hypothetical protein [uncultured Croceicoccus sp.]|uniref:hypothetical protein n=1 Tax=uncultured Croceicoccus sp. TaxID=1295329 RepID=UPI002639B70C|nr:hypothetical protein [uncultured Croceicoccus sp.]
MKTLCYLSLLLPVSLALSACGDDAAHEQGEVQQATVDEPGFEDTAATPSQLRSEAMELAQHLESGTLDMSETAVVLEDLDQLVTANIVEFPEDIRAKLTQDIAAAKSALETSDANGVAEAAASIESTLASMPADADAEAGAAAAMEPQAETDPA